jgi:hypothetical protein
MSINISARKCRLYVGVTDLSPCLATASGSDSNLDDSGLITHTAQFVLRQVASFNLNPRSFTSPFCRGENITFDVPNSDGVLTRFLTLKLLSVDWDEISLTLTINAGDRLTYLLGNDEPTNPKDVEIDPATGTTVRQVISQIAAKTSLAISGSVDDFRINYPVSFSGGYIKTIGDLVFSAGGIAWVAQNGSVHLQPVSLVGGASFTLQIGQDEKLYKFLAGAEAPAQKIKAVGVTKVAQPYNDAKCEISERYVNGICQERTETCTYWDYNNRILKTETKHWLTRSKVSPDSAEYYGIDELILAEWTVELKWFEKEKAGKLLRSETTIRRTYAAAIAKYAAFHKEKNSATWATLKQHYLHLLTTDPSEQVRAEYSYTSKGAVRAIAKTRFETEDTILSQTEEDYSTWVRFPDALVQSEFEEESWSKSDGRYTHTVSPLKAFAKSKPQAVTSNTTYYQKFELVGEDVERLSNDSIRPPEPERHPPKFNYEDQQVEAIALVPQRCGVHDRERIVTLQIPYLEGKYKPKGEDKEENLGDDGDVKAGPTPQALRLAQLKGALLYGRWMGQEIVTGMRDEYFSRRPLMAVDCIEPSGVTRSFLIDKFGWQLTQNQLLCTFDGIWRGDRLANSNGDPVNHTVYVKATSPVDPGDTEIQVEPLLGSIPIGATVVVEVP